MLAAPCLRRSRLRGPLIAGAAGLLCLSLVACSGSGAASPASTDTALPSAADASQAPSPAAPSGATEASSAAGSSVPASARRRIGEWLPPGDRRRRVDGGGH